MAILAWALVAAAAGQAPQPKGAAELTIDAGSRGNVFFPHAEHQKRLKDCNICHKIFPQSKGSIERLRAEKKLKPKHVMNTLCVACHRKVKAEHKPSGPTLCSKCHHR